METAIEWEYKPIEAKACIGLGDTYRQKSEIPAAIEHYQKALENEKKRDDKEMEANVFIGLGDAYREESQIQTALNVMKKVWNWLQKLVIRKARQGHRLG